MPRRRQVSDPDAIYHVTFRAPARRELFRDGDDRDRYLQLFGAEALKRDWSVFSYCLLGTHGHILIRARNLDLGDGFKLIHETYAVEFNRRWEEHGTLFSNGPSYTLIRSDAHLLGALRYIARNPVAAGLCARPGEWRWSAHASLAGTAPVPEFLTVGTVTLVYGSESRHDYLGICSLDDSELLAELRAARPDSWIAEAVDDLAISVTHVAREVGVCERAIFRRLAVQRKAVASEKGRTPE